MIGGERVWDVWVRLRMRINTMQLNNYYFIVYFVEFFAFSFSLYLNLFYLFLLILHTQTYLQRNNDPIVLQFLLHRGQSLVLNAHNTRK